MTPVLSVMSKTGWAACAVLALAGGVTLASCWPALNAAFATTGTASPVGSDPKQAEERFKKELEGQVAAVKGRSLFFIPPRPAPVTTVTQGPKITPPPPPPPPPPARYGGPTIQALVTGTVWFSDGKKAIVGETVGSGSSAVTVLAADSPFGVKLKWQDKEWDVAMFDRDSVVFPTKPPEKAPEPPKTDEKKPDVKADTAKPDDKKPGDPKIGEAKPGEVKPGEPESTAKPEPSKAEDPKTDASAKPAPTSPTPPTPPNATKPADTNPDKKVEGRL